jgi:uncharacterized surface protein with fasciclin (FAS1) repeats
MRQLIGTVVLVAGMVAAAQVIGQERTVMVGGAAMYPSKDIVDNAMQSKDHTTLVAAVKAAGLVDTLKGKGPFTVFAPTNAAFAALPAGTVETLLEPKNRSKLTGILTYHVVPGRLDAATLAARAKGADGKVKLKTVNGEELTVAESGGAWKVMDKKGNAATITISDVFQANGVIHVVDAVLMP